MMAGLAVSWAEAAKVIRKRVEARSSFMLVDFTEMECFCTDFHTGGRANFGAGGVWFFGVSRLEKLIY